MAPAKRSATGKTYADRLKFGDKDLADPDHDVIMLWLDQHIERVVGQLVGNEWSPAYVDQLRDWANRLMQEYPPIPRREWQGLGEPPKRPQNRIQILDKRWEQPLIDEKATQKPVVGFADLKVTCQITHLGFDWLHRHANSLGCVTVAAGGMRPPEWEVTTERYEIYFEVKSQITSLGELIRQIRFYEACFRVPPEFVVVAPGDKYAQLLRAQGIHYVFYTPDAQQALL